MTTNLDNKNIHYTRGHYSKSEIEGQKIGETTIFNKIKKTDVKCSVYQSVESDNVRITAWVFGLFVQDDQIGFMLLNPALYKSTHLVFKYPYIRTMQNLKPTRYKKVGLRLHQLAIEKSFTLGKQGIVGLDAMVGSHMFHHKLGYIPGTDNLKEEIQLVLNGEKKEISISYAAGHTKNEYDSFMYMTEKRAKEKITVYKSDTILL